MYESQWEEYYVFHHHNNIIQLHIGDQQCSKKNKGVPIGRINTEQEAVWNQIKKVCSYHDIIHHSYLFFMLSMHAIVRIISYTMSCMSFLEMA